MKNIVLIGMPGVGKSTIGVILAKLLGYSFIDTDLVIQHECGMLLKDIIADKGVDGFIETENSVCSGIRADKSVIATGGSVIYGSDAMRHLNGKTRGSRTAQTTEQPRGSGYQADGSRSVRP